VPKRSSKVKKAAKKHSSIKIQSSNIRSEGSVLVHLGNSGFTHTSGGTGNTSASTGKRDKARTMKLYAFPSLDRCNSLLFFPATLTKLMNSGDYFELEKMLNSRLAKRYDIVHQFPGRSARLSAAAFLNHMRLKDSVHPDSISCVHSTKVIENQIVATVYFKFTDNQFIYNAVVQSSDTATGKREAECFLPGISKRSERFFHIMDPSFASDSERDRAATVLDSEEDLIVYGMATLTLTIDDFSKKILKINFDGDISSVAPVSSPDEVILRRRI
jgi:hypothetical protein